MDDKGKFWEDSFQKALNAISPDGEGDNKKKRNGIWQKELVACKSGAESDILKLVKMIKKRQYDPAIIFSFGKRECESLAMMMAKMDLSTDVEKANVKEIFRNAMDLLSVSNMLSLLKGE